MASIGQQAVRLDLHVLSCTGGREDNQDRWHTCEAGACMAFLVCDGAGGHAGGAVAAALACSAAAAHWQSAAGADPGQLAEALAAADLAVASAAAEGTGASDMRTTAVMAAIDRSNARAAWAHAGDSRLYCFRAGGARLRTRDHSLVEQLRQAGVVQGDPSRDHPWRNVVASLLGNGHAEVSPGPLDCTLDPGDCLLLCTDGFWEYLHGHEVAEALAVAGSSRELLESLERTLLQRAAAGHDNYTAIAIRVLAAEHP